jgi:hypothetical protein
MKYPGISAGILEQYIGDKNRVGIGFSYQPAKQHKLAESFHWNRSLGFLNVYKFGLCTDIQRRRERFFLHLGYLLYGGSFVDRCVFDNMK